MAEFQVRNRAVGPEEPTFIIAEAGSNHNGDLDTAKRLIDEAAEAGADAVKFQTFRAEDLYVKESGEMEYLDDDRSIYEVIKSMEMPYDWIPELYDYCESNDVLFLSTPFDERSADELADYVPMWKVASYTSSHHSFLRHLAETDKPVVMSTGAHDMEEVAESVSVLREAGVSDLVLLQCVAAYPTPLSEINVRVVRSLADRFDVLSGLSDHTLAAEIAPAAAVSLGACVVEKHFTLDQSMDGPDHEFALEPDELDRMVSTIRRTETALGSGEKCILSVEEELYEKARRAIHVTEALTVGDVLTEENTKVLRPGERDPGLHPKFYDEILGTTVTRPLERGEGIDWSDLDL